MKSGSYEWWFDQLEKDEARLKELNEKGLAGLSKYDITIAYMGNAEMALEDAKQLKRNHIKFDKEHIAEFEAKGIQQSFL